MAVTDDLEALYLEVPGGWTEVNGSIWESTWGNLSFKAAYIGAAPDLDEFYDSLYSQWSRIWGIKGSGSYRRIDISCWMVFGIVLMIPA